MELPSIRPSLGDVIVDTDVVIVALSSFDSFKDGYEQLINPGDLFALFSLAEGIVLHERLLSEHIFASDLKRSETISTLVNSGVLGHMDAILDYGQNKPDDFQRHVWSRLEPHASNIAHWPGADFTLSASIARAKWSDTQMADHLPWPIFGSIPGEAIRRQHVINRGYAHVSNLMEQRVLELRGAGAPIPLYIPPIPTLILERCGTEPGRFFTEALALREEFAAARRKLWAYQNLISNQEDRSLGELCQSYKDSVTDVSTALDSISAKRSDSSLVLELWETVCEAKVNGGEAKSPIETGLNLGALLSKGFRWMEVQRVRARARLLFDIYKKALQV